MSVAGETRSDRSSSRMGSQRLPVNFALGGYTHPGATAMSDARTLYSEVKSELQAMASPLFDFAASQVRKRGAFLPFGATLSAHGEIALQAAVPEHEVVSSEEVLPILIDGLRQDAMDKGLTAVAVCEWVKIGIDGGRFHDAVKVHVHHSRGIAVAFYMRASKRLLGGWEFGSMTAHPADGLVKGWSTTGAT